MTHRGGCRRVRRPDLSASDGGWPLNFTAMIVRWWCSSLAGACSKGVAGVTSHGQNPFGLKIDQNDLVRCSRSWGVFSRVLELKMSVLGPGFYLERKTMFI